MNYHKCITNSNKQCLGREKFSINGKIQCCHEEIIDEFFIAHSVVDAIEDCTSTVQCIARVCTRISFATDAINPFVDANRSEILPELKRFALLVYENKERIISEKGMLELVFSFMHVVKNWFYHTLLHSKNIRMADNYTDSLKSDLQTLEMALGVCVLAPVVEESLDSIFF